MKFKDYFNSLVSKRKNGATSTKSNPKPILIKTNQDSSTLPDCHYDICGYDDVNSIGPDDQHSRTQVLLARHAELVNNIVGTRSSHDSMVTSTSQYRISHQPSPKIPPPLPPPLPPKLVLEQPTSFSNRNYSSTLATCSPRRECQHHPFPPPLPPPLPSHHHQHQQNLPPYFISTPYSAPNQTLMSSSNSSLWTTTTTASLSKKQRSKIRTNPWIGNNSINNRSSAFMEPLNTCQHYISPKMPPVIQPEYGIYDPTVRTSPLTLIHSESFPQATSNTNTHLANSPSPPSSIPPPAPTANTILHQSDSGHGFSLSSSRAIDSSSSSSSSSSSTSSKSRSPSPSNSSSADNTSSDALLSNDKQRSRQKKLKKKVSTTTSPLIAQKRGKHTANNRESYSFPHATVPDSNSLTRRKTAPITPPKVTLQYRYQRPSTDPKPSSIKPSSNQILDQHCSRSSSSRSIDDHFSLEFEEILENERSCKQRKEKQPSTKIVSSASLSSRKNPFILPLDGTNIQLPSPPPIVFSPTLTKTNSRAILKHIEDIENEIRLIKNLDLTRDDNDEDEDEYILSTHPFPEDINLQSETPEDDVNNEEIENKGDRKLINEQVDEWVEKCLQATNNTTHPTARLHTECDKLSNTMKDYVVCVCSNDDQKSSSEPKPSEPENTIKLMTAFYLSSVPARATKRTFSFINEPVKQEKPQSVKDDLQSIYECPF